ncbi:hypothetical protein NC652_034278, partial [Populus alba x Populus x berolinensis]
GEEATLVNQPIPHHHLSSSSLKVLFANLQLKHKEKGFAADTILELKREKKQREKIEGEKMGYVLRVRLASFFAGAATASFAGLYLLYKDFKVAHDAISQQDFYSKEV